MFLCPGLGDTCKEVARESNFMLGEGDGRVGVIRQGLRLAQSSREVPRMF